MPSPAPRKIIDLDVIEHLADAGYVVIGCGGGGIPVVEDGDGALRGVEAVIDKDLASSLLARAIGADLFMVSTGVERVADHFNKPSQRWLDRITRQRGGAVIMPRTSSTRAAWVRRSARSSNTSRQAARKG